MKINHIYQGHVIDQMHQFPDNSVDMIITSPPYWQQRKYDPDNAHDIIWGGREDCEHKWHEVLIPKNRGKCGKSGWLGKGRAASPDDHDQHSLVCSKCKAWFGELGIEPSYRLYLRNLRLVFREARRVLSYYGSMFIVIGDTYYGSGTGQKNLGKHACYDRGTVSIPATKKGTLSGELSKKSLVGIPHRLMLMLIDQLGLILRNDIIWYKPNAIPHSSKDKFTPDYEHVLFLTKKPRYWHELQLEPCKDSSIEQKEWGAVGGKKYANLPEYSGKQAQKRKFRTMRTVWEIPVVPSQTDHVAPFPPKLVVTPIQAAAPRQVCPVCGMPRFPVYDEDRRVRAWTECSCGEEYRRGIVLDPFAGSGTVLAVAKALDRDYVGIELLPDYVKDARKAVRPSRKQLLSWLIEKEAIEKYQQTTLDVY